MRKILKPLDFAAILIVLFAAAVSFVTAASAVGSSTELFATVDYDGGRLVLPLDSDGEYSLESGGYHIVLTIRSGVLEVESDCPDRLCCGKIDSPGATLVCMPARAVISIGGERSHDAIVG